METATGLEAGKQTVAVADLLQTLSREMAELGQRAEAMQQLVSPLIAAPSGKDLLGLQELDLMAQSLFALAAFTTHLEPTADGRLDLHAAAQVVTLADLARRLTGSCQAEVVAETMDGDLLLFD